MNVGITILIILGVVILGQLFIQGQARRREYEDILRRLDSIGHHTHD